MPKLCAKLTIAPGGLIRVLRSRELEACAPSGHRQAESPEQHLQMLSEKLNLTDEKKQL